jgi:hypothetical protein
MHNTMYIVHTCNIYTAYTLHTFYIHTHILHTRYIYIAYIVHTCCIHTTYMLPIYYITTYVLRVHTYYIRATYMLYTWHVTYMLLKYRMSVPCKNTPPWLIRVGRGQSSVCLSRDSKHAPPEYEEGFAPAMQQPVKRGGPRESVNTNAHSCKLLKCSRPVTTRWLLMPSSIQSVILSSPGLCTFGSQTWVAHASSLAI